MCRLIAALIFLSLSMNAQPLLQKLEINEPFPDITLKNVINYKAKSLKVADFKGKLTILDFWGTTCGGCIAAWPKLLKVQERFKDRLQIVLVNKYEDEKTIMEYIAKRKKLVGIDMTLPGVCGDPDSSMRALFPENSVPRYAWIDKDGVFRSLTQRVLETDVEKWLEDGYVEMPQIRSVYERIDIFKPMFIDGNGGTNKAKDFITGSMLTKYTPGTRAGQHLFASPQTGYGIFIGGSSIEYLYKYAFDDGNLDSTYFTWHLPMSQFRVLAPDTTKYCVTSEDYETGRALYNYQYLSNVALSRKEILHRMRQDLDRYFGFDANWESVEKTCIVFKMLDLAKAKYQNNGKEVVYMNDTMLLFDGITMYQIIRFMEDSTNYFFSLYPFVDETNYKGLIGIKGECNCYDLDSFAREMKKHGIQVSLEKRTVKILTIRERETRNSN